MGANVVVVEVNPVRALEAGMEGFRVMTMADAAKSGDVFVTVTGDKHAVSIDHMKLMKDRAILANSGHFDVEIDVAGLRKIAKTHRTVRPMVEEYVISHKIQETSNKKAQNTKRIYLLGEGRLINLAAAEGHPAEVMDMSFANQAMAAEYLVQHKGKLKPEVYVLPKKLDEMVATLKLKAMGMGLQKLTLEQKKYLGSWQEGT
jgi:adenosylhomocysteinase